MKKHVSDIATIQTGIYAQTQTKGDVLYLQARDFNEHGIFNSKSRPELLIDDKTRKRLLQEGDVLFVAKGNKNSSYVYHQQIGPAVPSSSFLVLRITERSDPELLPDFLVWYLNHPQTQTALKSKAKGSSIPSISVEDLAELEIYFPAVKFQQIIIDLDRLRAQERRLIRQIDALKEKHVQNKLLAKAKM